jgi:hypothetical protein
MPLAQNAQNPLPVFARARYAMTAQIQLRVFKCSTIETAGMRWVRPSHRVEEPVRFAIA